MYWSNAPVDALLMHIQKSSKYEAQTKLNAGHPFLPGSGQDGEIQGAAQGKVRDIAVWRY